MSSRPRQLLRLVTVEPVLFFYMLGIFLLYGVIQVSRGEKHITVA